MVSFDVNRSGIAYFINFAQKSINPETGSSHGNKTGLYYVIEQELEKSQTVVLPTPLIGYRVRLLVGEKQRVSGQSVEPFSQVAILRPDVAVFCPQNLFGFVNELSSFRNADDLTKIISDYIRGPLGLPVNDFIDKEYQALIKKFDLILP